MGAAAQVASTAPGYDPYVSDLLPARSGPSAQARPSSLSDDGASCTLLSVPLALCLASRLWVLEQVSVTLLTSVGSALAYHQTAKYPPTAGQVRSLQLSALLLCLCIDCCGHEPGLARPAVKHCVADDCMLVISQSRVRITVVLPQQPECVCNRATRPGASQCQAGTPPVCDAHHEGFSSLDIPLSSTCQGSRSLEY